MIKVWNLQKNVSIPAKMRENMRTAALFTLISLKHFSQKHSPDRNIIFVNDKEIIKLNFRFLNRKNITDVITFNYPEDKADIYINAPQCARQAKEHQQLFSEELTRVVIHGMLHSYDWKDYTKKQSSLMWEKQEYILQAFMGLEGK
ncbi:MAG: rRNA maturation RNase YbeY [Elusimicrobiota bacterium]